MPPAEKDGQFVWVWNGWSGTKKLEETDVGKKYEARLKDKLDDEGTKNKSDEKPDTSVSWFKVVSNVFAFRAWSRRSPLGNINGIMECLVQLVPKKKAQVFVRDLFSLLLITVVIHIQLYQSLTCSRRSRARIIASAVTEIFEVSHDEEF